ncbi:MAG: host specificity factor TipJ family phage tail protein [Rhodocyclaceae bacterium]|nr:host specificity factor TipJ family phage tail protein [Rhodocyclaceae bacterium]
MKALVTVCRDPFHPMLHRTSTTLRRRRRLRALAPRTQAPFICLINGLPALRQTWNRRVADGDSVVFVVLPQGGGGGGSNPMSIVLSIALMAVMGPAAGFLNDSLGLGLGEMGMAVLKGAIGIIGQMLISAMLPAPRAPTPQQATTLAAPSPTYSLGAQGNQARLGAAIPEMFGRHQIFPDFAAQPYVEYEANEQYLYQLLMIGQGDYSIESINIADTSITSFDDITTEVIPPYGTVTLFPTSVTTSGDVSGQEALTATPGATYSQSGTVLTVSATAHGLLTGSRVFLTFTSGGATTGDFVVASVPTGDTFTVTVPTGTTSGSVNIWRLLGPFTANAATTQANAIAIDVVFSRGLYYANTSGGLDARSVSWTVWAQLIDDTGAALGSWTILGNESFSAATTTPQRRSYRYTVAAGRYQVRLARTDVKDTASQAGHELDWAGMRAYLPGTQQYGNVTLVAMRMRASNNLSYQASRLVNLVATRKIPSWSPITGWSSPAPTRSLAWTFAYVAMTSNGGSLPPERIDLDALYTLDQTWATRGDHFDGVFDSTMTVWEALTQIARAGRAMPFMQSGVLHCVRDQAATVPVTLFTSRNMVRGSFSMQYLMPTADTPDCVDMTYFDSTTWTFRVVRAALAGSAQAVPAPITIFGVTDRNQAWREGMYMCACNLYRRRLAGWKSEMEGFIPSLGDLLGVQHDMPKWGQGGEIVAWDAATGIATVSEPLDWSAGGSFMIAFSKRDGSVAGPWTAIAGADLHRVQLTGWNPATDPTPDVGLGRERARYAFGPSNSEFIRVRLLTVKPRSAETADLSVVIESDAVHTADTGAAPGDTAWQLPAVPTVPVVTGLLAASMPDDVSRMVISWQAAAGADEYFVEQSADGLSWTRIGNTTATTMNSTALYGPSTMIRVCGVGVVRGPWTQVGYSIYAPYFWSGTDSNLFWTADTNLMWRS